MSRKFQVQYSDPKGAIAEKPGVGILLAAGTTVPTDGAAGYATGCIFFKTDGGEDTAAYINDGSNTSADFNALPTAGVSVEGVAAGYKIARGRHTTVAASDTVVTGLATVVSVVAVLDSDPGDNPMLVSASIGDQAGTPAAGSILIKTWQNTTGTDPTPVAATTFSKVVNWIAIGT